MEELPSTALKWPFPKTLNGRLWRLSSAIIIGGTAAFSKIWLGKLKFMEVMHYYLSIPKQSGYICFYRMA